MIIGIVAKYAGRISRGSIFREGAAAGRWYGPDPEILGRSSVRDVDRFCFYDDVVPLSYGAGFSSENGNEIFCNSYRYQSGPNRSCTERLAQSHCS